MNTIYFWSDPVAPLSEMWRVLRVGGRLEVGLVARSTMSKLPVTKYGFTLYDPDQIPRLLESAGFRGIEMVGGTDKRGELICAIGTKSGMGAV